MARSWSIVLSITLLLWRPLDFAFELAATLPTLGMRGVAGVVELSFHGLVAALAVAAARALSNGMSSARVLTAAALVASAAATVQSLHWSVLPHQTKPGDETLLSIAAIAIAALGLVYLARSRRMRELDLSGE
jgi:hypothetical protein